MGRLTKEEIRKRNIKKRKEMSFIEKEKKDLEIFRKITSLDVFVNAAVVLSYVSVRFEVNTINIIRYCFENKKKVYVPVCYENRDGMDFCCINSLMELHVTNLFLLEPYIKKERIFKDINSENSICVVPGICFSLKGDRIGFGKGYYDRFLKNFKGTKIGICYDFDLEQDFYKTSLDVPVNLVLTEKRILDFRKNFNYVFEGESKV